MFLVILLMILFGLPEGRGCYNHGNDTAAQPSGGVKPGQRLISSLFLGVGYEQPISERAFMDIMVLYNINETYLSPYTNPVFRIGFGFRL